MEQKLVTEKVNSKDMMVGRLYTAFMQERGNNRQAPVLIKFKVKSICVDNARVHSLNEMMVNEGVRSLTFYADRHDIKMQIEVDAPNIPFSEIRTVRYFGSWVMFPDYRLFDIHMVLEGEQLFMHRLQKQYDEVQDQLHANYAKRTRLMDELQKLDDEIIRDEQRLTALAEQL